MGNTGDSSKFYPNPSALQLTLVFFNRLGVDKPYQKEQTIHLKRLSWFTCRWIYLRLKQLPITNPCSAKRYSADNPKIVGSNHPMSHPLQSWAWLSLWDLFNWEYSVIRDSCWVLPSGALLRAAVTHISTPWYLSQYVPVCWVRRVFRSCDNRMWIETDETQDLNRYNSWLKKLNFFLLPACSYKAMSQHAHQHLLTSQ